ncbi:MAG: hypothetical protein ISS87_00080 [Candidatus Pacebacteria bacterium]|nr:hypothetical protein [Candidatus Paceibacterota bacterium]
MRTKITKIILVFNFLIILAVFFSLNVKDANAATTEELQQQIALLQQQIIQAQERLSWFLGEAEGWCYDFNVNLSAGDKGLDIVALNVVLKKQGFYSANISNYFGQETTSAVIKFQEKYAADILAFWGLTNGTGYVGITTRAKLNELYGCSEESMLEPEESCHISDLWSLEYCSFDCKCFVGQGDCDSNGHCYSGYCAQNVGAKYGQISSLDVCEGEDPIPDPDPDPDPDSGPDPASDPDLICADHNTEEDCANDVCYWYNSACHAEEEQEEESLKPDLVVSDIKFYGLEEGSPEIDIADFSNYIDETIICVATLKNQGNSDTSIFNVKWYLNENEVGYGSHDNLLINETSDGNVRYAWKVVDGTHTFKFQADVGGSINEQHVIESNENNNEFSKTIVVEEQERLIPGSDIEYIRPTAINSCFSYDAVIWGTKPGDKCSSKVAEALDDSIGFPDDFSSYIYDIQAAGYYEEDSCHVDLENINSDATIAKITVHIIARATNDIDGAEIGAQLGLNCSRYNYCTDEHCTIASPSSWKPITADWTELTWDWYFNPDTLDYWTVDDINNLSVGIIRHKIRFGMVNVTQLYVAVHYVDSPASL